MAGPVAGGWLAAPLVLVGFATCFLGSVSGQVLDVAVGDAGNFTISHNGQAWLVAGHVWVGDLSSKDGSLQVLSRSRGQGRDSLGAYESWTSSWASRADPGRVLIETSLRTYPTVRGVVIFEQHFPSGVVLDGHRRGSAAATLFPTFQRNPGPIDDLPCFAYHGIFPRMESCSVKNFAESHQGGAPLVIYNSTDDALPSLVFSPLDFPKAQHMASSRAEFGVGVKSTVEIIPAGWRQSSILAAGEGLNAGMMAWGDFVLRWTGKRRADMYADDVVGGIGFWTDNGGYYHYSTGRNRSKSYEEVLPEVKAYHKSLGVPFRHWQFDSWFYPKDGAVGPSGGGGGLTNWTAVPSVFPHGMAYIQSKIGLPMAMHNRQWSPRSDYIKNLTFEWYISERAAVPRDPLAFFSWFFRQQPGWGLRMYEQDWMSEEYDAVEALQTNITMGDLWLRGMAEGAAASGRVVQYCMPYSYDILSAAWYPAVTTARASRDYFHGLLQPQWAIGGTAMYYWALGILPFKDGFYSSTQWQVGGQTVGPERNPDREAIMAALSCAIVGPMDGINLLNASRVMATCRGDGKVLKPDRPATPSDWCFRSSSAAGPPEKCYVYQTHTETAGEGAEVRYLYMDEALPFSPEMVHLPRNASPSSFVVYNWYTRELSKLQQGLGLAAGYEGHCYALVAAVRLGWALLGELDKYVPLSRLRFPAVQVEAAPGGGSRLRVTVLGVAGESVRVCAAELPSAAEEAGSGAGGGPAMRCQTAAFGLVESSQVLLFEPSPSSAPAADAAASQSQRLLV